MAIKLNKTIKNQIVTEAIKSKFRPVYEKAVKELTVATRDEMVKNSMHQEVMELNPDLLRYVSSKNYCDVTHGRVFSSEIIGNLLTGRVSRYMCTLTFDNPVYACNCGINTDGLPQYKNLIKVIEQVESFYCDVTATIGSYTKAEKMFEDLPWTKEFYPEQISTCTGLVAKETIDKINEVMSVSK